jgi:hypothetical protein
LFNPGRIPAKFWQHGALLLSEGDIPSGLAGLENVHLFYIDRHVHGVADINLNMWGEIRYEFRSTIAGQVNLGSGTEGLNYVHHC